MRSAGPTEPISRQGVDQCTRDICEQSVRQEDERFYESTQAVVFDRERLAPYLAEHNLHFDPNLPIHQFKGGLANRNYLVTINGQPAVLRRPPSGDLPPGAHDMAREHYLLSRLSKIVTLVPASIHFCADTTIIGVPFQILEYRDGVVLGGAKLPRWVPPDAGERLSRALVDTLVQLHQVDPRTCDLGQFGRPAGFLQRTINGWRQRGYRAAAGGYLAATVSEVSTWLEGKQFAERAPTILHMDFKLDNFILDPDSLAPRAVVDWDMGTRGDPGFDLAVLLSYWAEPGEEAIFGKLDQMPTATGGFWSRDRVAQEYALATGRDLSDLEALYVLALLRLGVVFLQLKAQWSAGAVTDPRYAEFDQTAARLLGRALERARMSG
jgi:aminoglycoside phosphotransferase (APT) family kinase protein